MVSCPNDLSRKLVEHFCSIDKDDIKEDWHRGKVCERHQRTNFSFRHNEKPGILFSLHIYSDLLQDKLKTSSISFK